MTTFTNTLAFQRGHLNKYPEDWTEREKRFVQAYLRLIPPKKEERFLGSLYVVSGDGYSFGSPHKATVSAPHGMIALSDGTLLYVGNRPQFETRRQRTDESVYYIRSADGVNWTKRKKIVLENAQGFLFCEPHVLETKEGFLIALRRQCNEENQSIFETWLLDADRKLKHFTNQRKVTDGAPPHLLRRSTGDIVLTYGFRSPPFGQRARISRDEGKSWSDEYILDADGTSWDLGYPATIERRDGKLLTVYYQKRAGEKYPYENRFDILLNHLTRVAKIAEQYGFSPMMWSDMFFRLANKGQYYCTGGIPEAIRSLVPKNVTLVYWDYYSTDRAHYDGMLRAHQEFENPVVFAGGDSGWYGFAPHNRYAVRAWRAAMEACRENGVEDAFVTCWKDDGAECSLLATLPVLFSAAEYARGNFDEEAIAEKFRRFTGICMEDFLALDEVNLDTDSPVNPCKYMLYSDPFLGIFDRTVKGDGSRFSAVREGLRAGAKSVRYGYLFKTLAALCDVLEIKYDLGVRTRKAYRADDRGALAALVADYGELEKRLKAFYCLFLVQRERECKPQGFEKQDIRLGGLMQRVAHCRRILSEYLAGRRDRIEELEEHILPFADGQDGAPVCFNDWLHTAQIKPMM